MLVSLRIQYTETLETPLSGEMQEYFPALWRFGGRLHTAICRHSQIKI